MKARIAFNPYVTGDDFSFYPYYLYFSNVCDHAFSSFSFLRSR